MRERSIDKQLLDEAMTLVMMSHDDPAPGHQARLNAWRARSEDHAEALARAESQWILFGRIENALDEDYEQVFTYGSPGRAAYVGVRASF